MQNSQLINHLINQITTKLISQLAIDNDGLLSLIDPNDGKDIRAHYGDSHLGAALLIVGENDETLYAKGRLLVEGLIKRWKDSHLLPAYHYDFNNFAFIICHEFLRDEDKLLKERIRNIILSSPDSNHYTINWLPMRLLVNNKRAEWSGKKIYRRNISKCLQMIHDATNDDGGIEDRLPKGLSYNLQYNISSFATLCFVRHLLPQYNFSKGLSFLLDKIAPDGDINYQGRGCNQIFAWGPWIYILSLFHRDKELREALLYLNTKLDVMLDKNSMMLNNWDGKEKFLWWDYHYTSVYTAHLLLWLLLALKDYAKCKDNEPIPSDALSTGLMTFKTSEYFVSVFEGRKEYLAEYGPSINLLWTKQNGMIYKGGFGPWRGLFGNDNTNEDTVMLNYLGVVSTHRPNSFNAFDKVLNRLKIKNRLIKRPCKLIKYPVFSPISIIEDQNNLIIKWNIDNSDEKYFNYPTFSNFTNVKLIVDGKEVQLIYVAKIRNQYDWTNIYQSKICNGREWNLIIHL